MTSPSKEFRAQLSAEEMNERENRIHNISLGIQWFIAFIIVGSVVVFTLWSVAEAVMP